MRRLIGGKRWKQRVPKDARGLNEVRTFWARNSVGNIRILPEHVINQIPPEKWWNGRHPF